jgi:hypothetical protein
VDWARLDQDTVDMTLVYSDRLKALNGKGRCPKCGTDQVQLTAYIDVRPAQWKCRECKTRFEFEPSE